ncbi:MAG: DUF2269 family protein [Chloroflexota bacterium]
MDWILAILLFLHVAGAIIAFGPTFAFPFIGAMGGKEPMHVNFALRLQHRITSRIVFPLALVQGITGLLLVWRIGFEILSHGWLLLAIVLYLAALANAYFVLTPTAEKLIEATSTPPPPPPAGTAPSGPPPHLVALITRARTFGMVNGLLILVIVFLMVTKPF